MPKIKSIQLIITYIPTQYLAESSNDSMIINQKYDASWCTQELLDKMEEIIMELYLSKSSYVKIPVEGIYDYNSTNAFIVIFRNILDNCSISVEKEYYNE